MYQVPLKAVSARKAVDGNVGGGLVVRMDMTQVCGQVGNNASGVQHCRSAAAWSLDKLMCRNQVLSPRFHILPADTNTQQGGTHCA